MGKRLLVNTLGYAGLLPFLVAAGLFMASQTLFGLDPLWMFISYSAVILSFLAGVLWGRIVDKETQARSQLLLISSNIFALLAFGALLIVSASPLIAILILALAFLLLIVFERQFFDMLFSNTPCYYKYFRLTLTGLVLICHGVVLVLLSWQ